MCGIAGYISSDVTIDGRKMTAVLRHRGPDDTGELEEMFQGRKVYLGHNRLSIIDLTSAGHQPMSTADRMIHIVFNGEIYNFEELRARHLGSYSFHSRTDTEVLLCLYDMLGIGFLEELNGDFAIALYDKRRARFFLIRDRLGVKPLYYALVNDVLVFGSEIKALLASGLPFPLSEENIRNYFVFKYVPGDRTLFRDIRRVRPGHYLEYDPEKGRLSEKKYWSLEKRHEYAALSYPEAQHMLRDLLGDAVGIRLMADVPVGTFLSGGLDSTAISFFLKDIPDIAHYCARKTEADLRAEGTSSDYSYAQKIAAEWGLKFMPIDIGGDVLTRDHIRETVYQSDDLIADGSQIPSYLITRESAKTSKVMLSGMGADELFFGYAYHLMILISSFLDKFPRRASASLSHALESLKPGTGFFKSYRRYLHKLGKYYGYPGYRYGIYGIVGDFESALSVCRGGRENAADFLTAYFPEGSDPFECINRFDTENFLVKNLHYLDKICMAHSIEARVPFLDHRLAEFAFSLDRRYKLTGRGRTKRILKDTMRPVLPSYILRRKKAAFGMPLRSIFSSPRQVDRLLDRAFFYGQPAFSPEDIEAVIRAHISGEEDNSSLIYALISFQEWHKIFIGS